MTNSQTFLCPEWLKRYLSQEDSLTIKSANYLRDKKLLFHHTFNEGKRSRTMSGKLKGFGVLTGIPDFLIFEPKGGFHGLAIELKVIYKSGAKNRLTQAQKETQEELVSRGWKVVTVWTFKEFKQEIKAYLKK